MCAICHSDEGANFALIISVNLIMSLMKLNDFDSGEVHDE